MLYVISYKAFSHPGYQTENVKLYEEMRGLKEHQKEEITRLYLENKDLAANNVALKQLLEQKEVHIPQIV